MADKIRSFLVRLANWQHFGLLVIALAYFALHLAVMTTPPGGEGGVTVAGLDYGTSHTVLDAQEAEVSRGGDVLTGWNTSAYGDGATYKAGDTFTVTGNVTLYAQWSPAGYTAAGGEGQGGSSDAGGEPGAGYAVTYHPGLSPTIFDEVHYLKDGHRVLDGESPQRNEHPPLARLIITKSIRYLGDNPWGWRMPPIILSTLVLVMFYSICRRLSLSHRVSFLAVFFLAFENLFYIHGGMAMLDIYMVFFMTLAFWLYLRGPSWWLASAGAGACAALCKFSGLFVFVTIGLHWLYAERETLRSVAGAFRARFKRPEKAEEDSLSAAPGGGAPSAADTGGRAPAGDGAPPSPRGYRRVPLFILSMLIAPAVFLSLYAVCEYFIRGQWVDLYAHIKTALSGTSSIKFTYGGAYPSRPWEWLLSPVNAFSIYQWIWSGGGVPVKLLGYDWPPWGPHITAMTSPTVWLAGLAVLPWMIWNAVRSRLTVILPVVWFIGVGAVPALVTGIVSSLAAAVISYGWFALIIPLVFFMKKEGCRDNAAAFGLFWFIGSWAAWIPLAIITDRITYSFYYLPAVPAICLGAGLIIDGLLRRGGAAGIFNLRGLMIRGAVACFIFLHLVIFCLLSPNSLSISIPTSILVLAFSLDYLGYSYQSMVSAVVAVTAGVLGLRYVLYPYLERWFGTETMLGLYPASIWFWLTGAAITLAVMGIIFAGLRLRVLRPSPPPAGRR